MNLNKMIIIRKSHFYQLPVEMYLDVHFPYVYDNTVEHRTNIHHVFLLMYHHVVRQLLVNNPRKHSCFIGEKIDRIRQRTHNNFHALARYCFGIPFQLALRSSSEYETSGEEKKTQLKPMRIHPY